MTLRDSHLTTRILLTVAAVAALLWPAAGLFSDANLRGTDAYYYALQADSWYTTGAVRIPDPNPLHPLIGALMKSGLTGEEAVKSWQTLSVGLFCLAFLCFFRPLPSPAGLFFFLWALISPSLFFCALEFPKTFAFVIAFTLGLAAAKAGGRWIFLALLFFIQACVLHKMAIIYTVAALTGLFMYSRLSLPIWSFIARQSPLDKINLTLILLSLLPGPFLLPILLDIELPRVDVSNLTPGLFALFLEPNLPLAIKGELLLAAGLLAALCLKNPKGKRGAFLAVLLAAPAFIPAFGAEPFNLGERFALLFPVTVLLSAAFVCPSVSIQASSRQSWLAWAFILLALGGGFFRLHYSYPARLKPPYTEYSKIIARLERLDVPMLIAHWDFHFYYKYHTGREAFSYEPEKHWPQTRTWRLLYGPTPTELQAYLPPEQGWQDNAVILIPGTNYTLIREDVYEKFRAAVNPSYNQALYGLLWSSVMNPSRPRPAFLYQKHQNDVRDEFSALPQ